MNADIILMKKKSSLRGKIFLRPCFLNYAVFQQLLIKQDDKTMCVAVCWVGSERWEAGEYCMSSNTNIL